MIEALISPRDNDTELKKAGDVLCVKPIGSPWGTAEQPYVVLIDDPALEAQLSTPGSLIVYPYATYDDEGEMIIRSTVQIELGD